MATDLLGSQHQKDVFFSSRTKKAIFFSNVVQILALFPLKYIFYL